jgi:hypothetical protein
LRETRRVPDALAFLLAVFRAGADFLPIHSFSILPGKLKSQPIIRNGLPSAIIVFQFAPGLKNAP